MRSIGGGVFKSANSVSFTTAAANKCRVQQLSNAGSFLEGLMAAENEQLAISQYKVDFDLYHPDAPFEALVVIVLGSPALTAVSGNSVEDAPHLITEEWITDGEFGAIYSPFINSRRIVDSGNLRYIASYSLDLTKIAKTYAAMVSASEMKDDTAPQLIVGMIVWSDIAGNPVTADLRTRVFYNLAKRTFRG
jgi:hypothetical protein